MLMVCIKNNWVSFAFSEFFFKLRLIIILIDYNLYYLSMKFTSPFGK